MERVDIEKQLLELPEKISETAHELQTAANSLEEEREKAKREKLTVMLAVYEDLDDKGKKRYSTVAVREAEVQKRLSVDPASVERKAKIDALRQRSAYLEIDLQKYANLFAAYRAIAGMTASGG